MLRKRFTVLVTAFVMGSTLGLGARPALATHVSCSFQGNAFTSGGLGLPPTSNTVSYTFTSNVAMCSNLTLSVSASGLITGTCFAMASTSGSASVGGVAGSLTFQTYGELIVFGAYGGAFYGIGHVSADPTLANNSCITGTARVFIITGDLSHG